VGTKDRCAYLTKAVHNIERNKGSVLDDEDGALLQ
jgi:hypothetical protein